MTHIATQPELAPRIEHTLLAATATDADVEALCRQAAQFSLFGVCINGGHVARCRRQLGPGPTRVVTVVGFPLGASLSDTKAFECDRAVAAGADEIDMVIDLGAILSGRFRAAEDDVAAVVAAAQGRPVKVILETGALEESLIRRACQLAQQGGAAFVKTSTGFGTRGASVADVVTMRAAVGETLRVKASGGIRTRAQALELVAAGADRLGTSCGPELLA